MGLVIHCAIRQFQSLTPKMNSFGNMPDTQIFKSDIVIVDPLAVPPAFFHHVALRVTCSFFMQEYSPLCTVLFDPLSVQKYAHHLSPPRREAVVIDVVELDHLEDLVHVALTRAVNENIIHFSIGINSSIFVSI